MSGYEKAYSLMEEIWNNFSEKDKQWFISEDPILMHSTLGRHLRNYADLWQTPWTPEVDERGIDMSPNHPDAISSKVIQDFQTKMKGEVK